MRGVAGQQFHGGDVLRKLRGKLPKTKLAAKAGITRQTLARFEEAPAKAQAETVRRVAVALDTTPDELRELLGIAGIPPETAGITKDAEPAPKPTGVPSPTVAVAGKTLPDHKDEHDASFSQEAWTMTVTVTAAEMQMIGAVRGLNKKQHHAFARAVSAMADSWAAGRSKRRRLVHS